MASVLHGWDLTKCCLSHKYIYSATCTEKIEVKRISRYPLKQYSSTFNKFMNAKFDRKYIKWSCRSTGFVRNELSWGFTPYIFFYFLIAGWFEMWWGTRNPRHSVSSWRPWRRHGNSWPRWWMLFGKPSCGKPTPKWVPMATSPGTTTPPSNLWGTMRKTSWIHCQRPPAPVVR